MRTTNDITCWVSCRTFKRPPLWKEFHLVDGRGDTKTGGFHWTSDGKKVAFISTNYSQVDEFTASMYHPNGKNLRQYPQMLKQIYPLPGRPAPKVKLNVVQLPQGSLTHIKPPKELDGQVSSNWANISEHIFWNTNFGEKHFKKWKT